MRRIVIGNHQLMAWRVWIVKVFGDIQRFVSDVRLRMWAGLVGILVGYLGLLELPVVLIAHLNVTVHVHL